MNSIDRVALHLSSLSTSMQQLCVHRAVSGLVTVPALRYTVRIRTDIERASHEFASVIDAALVVRICFVFSSVRLFYVVSVAKSPTFILFDV